MVKQKAVDLIIKCKLCGTEIGRVKDIFEKIQNEWDPNEPTGWVQQHLKANDLAVMTHYHISCPNSKCEKFQEEIAVLKMDFLSRENKSQLTF